MNNAEPTAGFKLPGVLVALLLLAQPIAAFAGPRAADPSPGHGPRRSAAPARLAAPANPLEALMQVARLEGEVEECRGLVEKLQQDSLATGPDRMVSVQHVMGRLAHLTRRLDELDQKIASIPTGNPLAPILLGLNPDSLARALATQWMLTARNLGETFQPLVPDLVPGTIGASMDRYSDRNNQPLAPLVSRKLSAVATLPPGVELLTVLHRFGNVRVEPGPEGQVSIEGTVSITGGITDAEARILADSVKVLTESGSNSTVAVQLPPLRTGQSVGIQVNITVRVPVGVPVHVQNSYGDVSLAGLKGRVECLLSFGDLDAESLSGGGSLQVRSGRLRGTQLSGSLRIDSQAGSVDLREISDTLNLEGAGSEITVDGLGGGGALRVRGGSLQLRNVGGSVLVTCENSPVSIEGVRGGLNLSTQSCRAEVAQVSGQVNAQCLGGSFTSSFVQQAQDLRTRFCQVQVTNPGGDVSLQGESAPALLRLPEGGAARSYDANVRNGNVTLEVPERCSASIHASTNSGTIFSDVPLARQDVGDWQRGQATLGQGGSQISLGGVGASVRIVRLGR